MSRQAIFFGFLTLAAVLVAGVIIFQTGKENTQENADRKPAQGDLAKGISPEIPKDRTLPGFKKTGVTELDGPYKKVTVSDGEVTFSFEVPDEWLTETRNSGEIPMTEEEMREFFKTKYDDGQWGDYRDFTDEEVDRMSLDQLKNLFEEAKTEYSSGYPNASVSSGNAIWYTDLNGNQIDFSVLSEEISKKYYDFPSARKRLTSGNTWKEISIDGYEGMIIENENKISKGSDGKFAYIHIPEFKKYVIVRKYSVESKGEDGFSHLMNTLHFLNE